MYKYSDVLKVDAGAEFDMTKIQQRWSFGFRLWLEQREYYLLTSSMDELHLWAHTFNWVIELNFYYAHLLFRSQLKKDKVINKEIQENEVQEFEETIIKRVKSRKDKEEDSDNTIQITNQTKQYRKTVAVKIQEILDKQDEISEEEKEQQIAKSIKQKLHLGNLHTEGDKILN